jgi:cysteine-rich repeat protein
VGDAALWGDGATVCGNSVRETNEECDDGNSRNLDGCNSNCLFEQNQRVNSLVLQYGVDSTCTSNGFGNAFVQGPVTTFLQSAIDSSVASGEITILFKLLDLNDLGGVNDPAIRLGMMSGKPYAGSGYNGASDLDWWYKPDPTTIDTRRDPLVMIKGSIGSRALTAGPGRVKMPLNLAGVVLNLAMSNIHLRATVGPSSSPLSSTGAPPGHLTSMHLDPSLTSFSSAGGSGTSGTGHLCGNIPARELQIVPVPSILTGSLVFSQNYSTSNTMLDVMVHGCSFLAIMSVVNPTQPDTEDPGISPVGTGPPYRLLTTGNKVTGCRDQSNTTVNLSACLDDAAYSIFFKFASGRVIIK